MHTATISTRPLRLRGTGVGALLLALAIVLGMAAVSYRAWRLYSQQTDELDAAQRIVHGTADLLSILKDAESGQRGFLLTGEDRYLEPYRRALSHEPAIFDTLAAAARSRPGQSERIARLKPLINEKFEELRETTALRRTRGFDAAVDIVRTGRGVLLMHRIRAICAEIETAANNRMAQFTHEAQSSANLVGLIATVGGLILFAFLAVAALVIQNGFRRRQELIEDLQRSEVEVKAARDWLQTTLGSIGDAVITTDAEGRVTFLNPAAQSLTGWTAEEAAGVPLDRVFVIHNEATGATVENPVVKVLQSGRVAGLANHTLLTSKDGRQIPIDDSAAPIRDAGDKILGVVLVFRDVSERRAAELELRRSAERIRALFNASPIGVLAGDIHGRVNEANDAFLAMIGYSREELISGQVNWEAITPLEFRNADRAGIADAKARGTCTPYAKEFVRKDGTRVPVFVGFALLGDAREESVAFIIDVTEMRKAERNLRESHARFQRLFDSNVVGIVIAGEHRILEANNIFLDMLGWSREDLEAGRADWEAATPPEFLGRDRAAIRQFIEQGSCTAYEKEFVRPDGTRVPVLTGSALLTAEPEPTWISFVADLTRQKTLERELQQSNQELQRFAYVVAHDLQAPLRTVSSMTSLLVRRLEGKLDADLEEVAGHIRTGAARMTRLISDLLDYARASNAPVAFGEEVDTSVLFAWTVMNLQTQIEESGAKVITGPLPTVLAGDQLIRVFQNLIDNALKYRGECPPEIHVSAERVRNEWVFSVRDNGIGFEMQYAERIFGIFQRLHGVGQYEGTGIGLAISRRLIERYGGRMWAESEPGVGSTFRFTLPAAGRDASVEVGRVAGR